MQFSIQRVGRNPAWQASKKINTALPHLRPVHIQQICRLRLVCELQLVEIVVHQADRVLSRCLLLVLSNYLCPTKNAPLMGVHDIRHTKSS